ncbi:MAG: shikimate dehydrogenase [Acetivibrionales bacterium]|jgi:shikimate dehydrogenase
MPKSHPILCGSIAGSIGGMGVKMHNAAFQHLNLPYVYVSFETASAKGAVDAMRALGIRGLGVTMPFKEEVIQYLDDIDEMSGEIGAVNTIVNDDGKLKGYNTDAYGAITTLLEVTPLKGKKIVVVGAGGAAKTVIWALKQYTDSIFIYNRNPERGQSVGKRFNVAYMGGLEELGRDFEYDILINCTSVGFKSEATILTRDRICSESIVMDIVFTPAVTALQKEAKAAGCTVISGTRMIMHQACKQFELYTGLNAPFDIYEEVINTVVR